MNDSDEPCCFGVSLDFSVALEEDVVVFLIVSRVVGVGTLQYSTLWNTDDTEWTLLQHCTR